MNVLLRSKGEGVFEGGQREIFSFGEIFVSVEVKSRRSHEKTPMFDAQARIFERAKQPGEEPDPRILHEGVWDCRLEFKTSAPTIGELLDVTGEFLRRKLSAPVTIIASLEDDEGREAQ